LIYLLPLLALIGWGTIFLSHKIAGPLYRFDQCFKDLSQGDLTTRARLRKNDEAIWLSKSFNQMTESLDSRVSTLKNAANEVARQLPNSNPSKNLLDKTLSGFRTSQ
jgi:methyl-accepting chemotaxis protein